MSSPVFNEDTIRHMERGGSFHYDQNGNPVASQGFDTQTTQQPYQIAITTPGVFTVNGALTKTAILLTVVVASAIAGALFVPRALYMPIMLASLVITVGLSFWMARDPKRAKTGAVIYAVVEGVTVGMFSLYIAQAYGAAIIIQALVGTVAVTVAMLFLYATRLIKVTEKFLAIIYGATLGIFIMYIVGLVGRLAFGAQMAFIFGNGWLSIGISAAVIVVAAFNLAIDFDLIETMKNNQVAKYYEWYAAFGVMVTLVWLYFEILHLLAKLQSRD